MLVVCHQKISTCAYIGIYMFIYVCKYKCCLTFTRIAFPSLPCDNFRCVFQVSYRGKRSYILKSHFWCTTKFLKRKYHIVFRLYFLMGCAIIYVANALFSCMCLGVDPGRVRFLLHFTHMYGMLMCV